MRRFLLGIATLLAILSSCNDDAAVEQNGLPQTRSAISDSLAVNTSFIKLADDTTGLEAGFLEITAPTQEVSIKWNVLPDFNIDTTATTMQMRDGKISLPIKWKNCLRSHHHAPQDMSFQGGVIVIAENEAKYVRLILAEKVDSVKLNANPVIMVSPEAPYPAPRAIYVEPQILTLLPTMSSFMRVNTFDIVASMNLEQITPELNIDLSKINTQTPGSNLISGIIDLEFAWTAAGPPPFSFYRKISFTQGGPTGVAFDAYISYSAPGDPVFRLISILPDKPGFISAENGFVKVGVETNAEWSVASSLNKDADDKVDVGEGTLQKRTLQIDIQDNNTPSRRTVTIVTKSKGVEKDVTDFDQQGADPNLFLQYESNTIATPIPKEGGTYTITFKGDYEGPLLVRPVIAGEPGIPGAVTNTKKAMVIVPENPTAEDRNITFEFSVDGENWAGRRWAAVSPETDRIQLGTNGGGEVTILEYESDNLPVGANIPQVGGEYTFDFKGTYKGRLRVRASVNGTWYTGVMVSTLHPSITIPANNTTNVLPVKFQYRAFDADPSTWIYLPDKTKRNQDALANAGTLEYEYLIPAGEITEWGEPASCKFKGTYAGDVYVQAVANGVVIAGPVKGKVGDVMALDIPQLKGSNRIINFQYRKEGEEWQTFTTRAQNNGIIAVSGASPTRDLIAEGEPYIVTFTGTYTKKVTLIAEVEDGGGLGGKVTIAEQTAYINPKHEFRLMIPANLSKYPRGVGLCFIREDLPDKKHLLEVKVQLGKK